ncbi:MAG: LysE family transporter [Phaeodactylibacter sp.]|uniref:LysE family translocator n=1 Tax=Phaeodactylibacter sp. TaxID=1940289 RepID=UPI0032EB40D3
MNLIFEGVKVGLILALLIGPIFFAIIQAGVEEGFRAGAAVGFGIWVSDFLFIAAVYFGLTFISQVVESPHFGLYLGIGGSITLAAFGLGALLTVPKAHELPKWSKETIRTSSYPGLWLKGFLINTVNPFTFFFWIGVASTVVVDGEMELQEARYFFGGILGTIIITDLLKVLLAKRIRRILKPVHLLWLRRISGIALVVFAVALLGRVLWML